MYPHATSAEPLKTPPYTPRIGETLLEWQAITPDQLHIALHEQRRVGTLLGTLLVELGFLNEDDLTHVLAERTGLSKINLRDIIIDPALVQKVPHEIAHRCRAIPIALNTTSLEIAMADPYDIVAIDEIRRYFPRNLDIVPFIASETDIVRKLDQHKDFASSLDDILKELENLHDAFHIHDPQEGWQHPVIKLVNTILMDAVHSNASDIHLEPENNLIRLRYRVDGILRQTRVIHRAHWPELSHRLKIMAAMNIADTRSLQDGRFQMPIGGAMIDFRMAVMPTVQGENIVIRILDQRRALLPIEKLGFDRYARSQLDDILQRPEGLILVTGPTGCGKTTSLYSILNTINTPEVNIMTLEEPVEYQLNLIRQTAVQEKHGLSFADGVRGILRQDPNIIFIGEIRDHDTAQMALRAAMTGHQVFSTIHCNDALGAFPRLLDLGLSAYTLSGNISGIITQRLVRTLCKHCKTLRSPTEGEHAMLSTLKTTKDVRDISIGQAMGCPQCHDSGYLGRTVIVEVLPMTRTMDTLIVEQASRPMLMEQARTDGLRTMAENGLEKIINGQIDFIALRQAVDLSGIAHANL